MSTHTPSFATATSDLPGDQGGRRATAAGSATSRDEVSFQSGGDRCAAWLYRPAGPGPRPCVVMAHGLGGIRSAVLPDIAERFAQAGLAVLVFDYRCLGGSEGQPRGLIDIGKQRADYHAAIACARSSHGIDPDRVAVWGTSFSGGHVLTVAAADPRVAAAVIQNPLVDGRAAVAATVRSAGYLRTAALLWHGLRDEARRLLGRAPHRVDLAGEPGDIAMITTPDAVAGYELIMPDDPVGWEPAAPARIVLRLGTDRPGATAPRIGCPLLVCVCDHDRIAPPGPARRVAKRAPHGELRRYPIGHFDLFTGHWFDQVVGDQVAFLRRALLDATPGPSDR